METNEQQNKSTRTFEEWKLSLRNLIDRKKPGSNLPIINEKVKPYYDQGLMPEVAYKDLFNR